MVFNTAYLWIDANLINDKAGERLLVQGSRFWEWWTHNYTLRIKRFYLQELCDKCYITMEVKLQLRMKFEAMHQPAALNLWPNKSVLYETYQICIDNLALSSLTKTMNKHEA